MSILRASAAISMTPDAVGRQQGARTYTIIHMSTSITLYAKAINREQLVCFGLFDSMN
jgi:hypothetical protein